MQNYLMFQCVENLRFDDCVLALRVELPVDISYSVKLRLVDRLYFRIENHLLYSNVTSCPCRFECVSRLCKILEALKREWSENLSLYTCIVHLFRNWCLRKLGHRHPITDFMVDVDYYYYSYESI